MADVVEQQLCDWWAERREVRPDAAWEVPFPLGGGQRARVFRVDDEANKVWRASLFRPRAMTAFIEVESGDGPLAALQSLYEHVGPNASAHRVQSG